MAKHKKDKIQRTRVSLDLTQKDLDRVDRLKTIYDTASQTEVIRTAIRHDIILAEFVKAGGKIQHIKEDGTSEIIGFTDWLPYYTKSIAGEDEKVDIHVNI